MEWSESWAKFEGRMRSEFKEQLFAYRRTVDVKFDIGREEHLNRDAAWTVLYQRGESVIAISEKADLKGYSDPEQAIFRVIKRFAEMIGLRLRRRGYSQARRIVQE
jgi:hypothetical protein